MNRRERMLATAVLATVLLGGLFLIVYQFYLVPLTNYERTIERLVSTATISRARRAINAERPKLDRWRLMSLTADVNRANVDYGNFLNKMSRKSFSDDSFATAGRDRHQILWRHGTQEGSDCYQVDLFHQRSCVAGIAGPDAEELL